MAQPDALEGQVSGPVPRSIWAGLLCRRVGVFDTGRLVVELPDGQIIDHKGAWAGTTATIHVHSWRLVWKLISEGEHGLGRAYVDGDWSTPDLGAVLAFGLENVAALSNKAQGWRLFHLLAGVGHAWRANTRRGSRRNIAQHYDLGNAFYGHWLDGDMNYSSGLYATEITSLADAQSAKTARVAELLACGHGDRVLEIGCGWGSLARYLLTRTSCKYVGITLSREQLSHAQATIAGSPLEARARFDLCDYRDAKGTFDRIVSVEMFEAVGEQYWPVFFRTLRERLAEGGSAVLQVITIKEPLFESYRQRPDFIQRYIFPGGMLPTAEIVRKYAAAAGLKLVHEEGFGQSYARTLADWRSRFADHWPEIEKLGFDERFRRMWTYYLAYCEAGFRFGQTDVRLFKFLRGSPTL